MEEHIVAAHSAIIIAYLLKNMSESGQSASPKVKAIEPARLKCELSSGSFQSLVDVIDKYLSFMDIMVS